MKINRVQDWNPTHTPAKWLLLILGKLKFIYIITIAISIILIRNVCVLTGSNINAFNITIICFLCALWLFEVRLGWFEARHGSFEARALARASKPWRASNHPRRTSNNHNAHKKHIITIITDLIYMGCGGGESSRAVNHPVTSQSVWQCQW